MAISINTNGEKKDLDEASRKKYSVYSHETATGDKGLSRLRWTDEGALEVPCKHVAISNSRRREVEDLPVRRSITRSIIVPGYRDSTASR